VLARAPRQRVPQLTASVRHPRLLDASGSGQEARGPVRTMVVRIRRGSAGLPVFGRPRPHAADRSRGRADGGKIQLSAFSYQLSAKGPGGRGKDSAISLQLSALSQGAGRTGEIQLSAFSYQLSAKGPGGRGGKAAGVSCHITQRGEITAKLPPLAMRIGCVPSASGELQKTRGRRDPPRRTLHKIT